MISFRIGRTPLWWNPIPFSNKGNKSKYWEDTKTSLNLCNLKLIICLTLAVSDDVNKVVQETVEKLGSIDILINNAAIICPGKELLLYSHDEISNMVEVNLTAPILLTFYLLNQLTDIININSMVGLEIKSPRTLYSATKWGLRGFAQSLKEELNEDLGFNA